VILDTLESKELYLAIFDCNPSFGSKITGYGLNIAV
jgi:hypothetical protein